MKSFLIGLLLGLSCLSVFAQDQNYFRQGESMIILRNPTFNTLGLLDDTPNEWSLGIGTQLEYGYFFKERTLIGGGVHFRHSTLFNSRPINLTTGVYGFQLFARYYFTGLERGKHNFSLFVEPRVQAYRFGSRSTSPVGNFVNEGQSLNLRLGLFLSWRFAQRGSLDLGIQPTMAWVESFSTFFPQTRGPLYNVYSSWSINFHL